MRAVEFGQRSLLREAVLVGLDVSYGRFGRRSRGLLIETLEDHIACGCTGSAIMEL